MKICKKTLAAGLLAGSLLLAGCGNRVSDGDSGGVSQSGSACLAAMTQEDMMEKSALIVCGTVTAQSEPFQIVPANGADPSWFTDYTVSVEKVLRGDETKKSVTVRVEGQPVNGTSSVVEEALELEEKQKVLLYLYAPGVGMMYHAEGDYYYVTGMNRGVYTVDGENFVNENNESDPDLKAVWNADELEQLVREYTASHPVNENAIREKMIQRYEEELASGTMTQREYDKAIQELDTYATIVGEPLEGS